MGLEVKRSQAVPQCLTEFGGVLVPIVVIVVFFADGSRSEIDVIVILVPRRLVRLASWEDERRDDDQASEANGDESTNLHQIQQIVVLERFIVHDVEMPAVGLDAVIQGRLVLRYPQLQILFFDLTGDDLVPG